MAVTLEVDDAIGIDMDIYAEVRDRIRSRIRV
jgi:predicted transcriptional regulator